MARPEIIKTPLGERLRIIRKVFSSPEPNRDQFSKMLGASKNSIANYERGDTLPDAAVLAEYRNLLNINLNWLLTGDGEMYDAIESVLEKMSGDKFMADNIDSDDGKSLKVDQVAFQKALMMANEFERKGGGKLMPSDKIEIIWEFYQDLIKQD